MRSFQPRGPTITSMLEGDNTNVCKCHWHDGSHELVKKHTRPTACATPSPRSNAPAAASSSPPVDVKEDGVNCRYRYIVDKSDGIMRTVNVTA